MKNLKDGGYITHRGIDEYSEAHEFDFRKFFERMSRKRINIVDVGCGQGNFLRDVRDILPSARFVGVDIKDYGTVPGIEKKLADATEQIPLQDRTAEVLVSTTLAQWISNDKLEDFYKELNRILSPSGYALIFPFVHVNCSFLAEEIYENLPQEIKNNFRIRWIKKGPAKTPVTQLVSKSFNCDF